MMFSNWEWQLSVSDTFSLVEQWGNGRVLRIKIALEAEILNLAWQMHRCPATKASRFVSSLPPMQGKTSETSFVYCFSSVRILHNIRYGSFCPTPSAPTPSRFLHKIR